MNGLFSSLDYVGRSRATLALKDWQTGSEGGTFTNCALYANFSTVGLND